MIGVLLLTKVRAWIVKPISWRQSECLHPVLVRGTPSSDLVGPVRCVTCGLAAEVAWTRALP